MPTDLIKRFIPILEDASRRSGRNLQMPGDPHYQPVELKAYTGYDQRVLWQILVEVAWLYVLNKHGKIPDEHIKLLDDKLLLEMCVIINTTAVTEVERNQTGHDILALRWMMERRLPPELNPYLHFGLTSYDVICTSYAAQLAYTYRVIKVSMIQLDETWRQKIKQYAEVTRLGRTHLQHALPTTIGYWLSVLHSRFINTALRLDQQSQKVTGKISGAVGTKASMRALVGDADYESDMMDLLGLPQAQISTQIAQPEEMQRFYHEMLLMSAVLANLGEDCRHLQSSDVGEINSVGSTSSTMPHKTGNPIAAENLAGMYRSVVGEYTKITLNSRSDLERDLRDSNVMRSYHAMFTFVAQQLKTANRLLNALEANTFRCEKNMESHGSLVTAELLHLSLQQAGYGKSHDFVNTAVVPNAVREGLNLRSCATTLAMTSDDDDLRQAMSQIPGEIWEMIEKPETYIGDAVAMAQAQSKCELKPQLS